MPLYMLFLLLYSFSVFYCIIVEFACDMFIVMWPLSCWTFTCHISDPEISRALTVTGTTQESVTLTWSISNTRHVDMIQLYQREIDESTSAAGPWLSPTNTSSTSSHTVTSLRPGTKYEFYVQIHSYGKTARTDSITSTTGETTPGFIIL